MDTWRFFFWLDVIAITRLFFSLPYAPFHTYSKQYNGGEKYNTAFHVGGHQVGR